MISIRIPTLIIHLTVFILVALFVWLLEREALSRIRPLHIVSTCEPNITLLMARTLFSRRFPSTDSLITISLITLSMNKALPPWQKVNFIFFFANAISHRLSHIYCWVIIIFRRTIELQSSICPSHIVYSCIIKIAYLISRASIKHYFVNWISTWMRETNPIWARLVSAFKRRARCLQSLMEK